MRLHPSGRVTFLAATCLVTMGGLEPAQAQTLPTFAVDVRSVFIDAFVTRDRRPVAGLDPRDFELKDNGVRQIFDVVPADALPISTVLVFDTSASVYGAKLNRLHKAAGSFLEHLKPDDEAGLIAFSSKVLWLAPPSTDHEAVRRAVGALSPRGATSLLDALFSALILPRPSSRPVIIVFSDGEDNMSFLDPAAVASAARRSSALIYVVAAPSEDFRSGPVSAAPSESAHLRTLRTIAAVTGGALIEARTEAAIETAFTEILASLKSRYVLKYAPEGPPAPGWHKLELKLTSGKGAVRARDGYWVDPK